MRLADQGRLRSGVVGGLDDQGFPDRPAASLGTVVPLRLVIWACL